MYNGEQFEKLSMVALEIKVMINLPSHTAEKRVR